MNDVFAYATQLTWSQSISFVAHANKSLTSTSDAFASVSQLIRIRSGKCCRVCQLDLSRCKQITGSHPRGERPPITAQSHPLQPVNFAEGNRYSYRKPGSAAPLPAADCRAVSSGAFLEQIRRYKRSTFASDRPEKHNPRPPGNRPRRSSRRLAQSPATRCGSGSSVADHAN